MYVKTRKDDLSIFTPKVILSQYRTENGSFTGDESGEVDTRFSFCALAALWLLGRLEQCIASKSIDIDRCVRFIDQCQNFDGGFGSVPGAESHAGQSKT